MYTRALPAPVPEDIPDWRTVDLLDVDAAVEDVDVTEDKYQHCVAITAEGVGVDGIVVCK